jgi:hypothetical protein
VHNRSRWPAAAADPTRFELLRKLRDQVEATRLRSRFERFGESELDAIGPATARDVADDSSWRTEKQAG